MSKDSFKVKKGLTLTPVDSTTIVDAEVGDLILDSNDGKLKAYDGAQFAETGGSGSGSGGINYLEGDDSDFENSVGNWTTGVAGTTIASIGPGEAILRGNKSGFVTKAAGDQSGSYVKVPFTIDKADLAKKLTISFDSNTTDITIDGDFTVEVVKDPAGTPVVLGINGADIRAGSNTHYAQFQTDATELDYELRIKVNTTETTSLTMIIDNVSVGPTNLAYGAIVTDWEDYTPTFNSGFTAGTGDSRWQYRRVGGDIEIRGDVELDTGFSLGTGNFSFSLPSGLNLDDSKLINYNVGFYRFPSGGYFDANGGTGQEYGVSVIQNGASTNSFIVDTNNGIISATVPFTWGVDDTLNLSFSAPIQGWSSNAQMSEDLGGREVVASGYLTSNTHTSSGSFEKIPFNIETKDTTSSYDNSLYRFTAPETGEYDVFARTRFSSISMVAGDTVSIVLYKNGSPYKKGDSARAGAAQALPVEISTSISLEKDDYIEFWISQSITASQPYQAGEDESYFYISKKASPQTILETETVAARYTSSNGLNIGTSATVLFEEKQFDTHNAMSGDTYTVPVSGYYHVSAGLGIQYSSASATDNHNLSIAVSGPEVVRSSNRADYVGAINESNITSTVLYLEKGDTVTIISNCSQSVTLVAGSVFNYISIARIK